MRDRHSITVVPKTYTILDAAVTILADTRKAMGPTEIAEQGVKAGILRIPRGRTKGYLSQTLQSVLQANATQGNSSKRLVFRPRLGKYRATKKGVVLYR